MTRVRDEIPVPLELEALFAFCAGPRRLQLRGYHPYQRGVQVLDAARVQELEEPVSALSGGATCSAAS